MEQKEIGFDMRRECAISLLLQACLLRVPVASWLGQEAARKHIRLGWSYHKMGTLIRVRIVYCIKFLQALFGELTYHLFKGINVMEKVRDSVKPGTGPFCGTFAKALGTQNPLMSIYQIALLSLTLKLGNTQTGLNKCLSLCWLLRLGWIGLSAVCGESRAIVKCFQNLFNQVKEVSKSDHHLSLLFCM